MRAELKGGEEKSNVRSQETTARGKRLESSFSGVSFQPCPNGGSPNNGSPPTHAADPRYLVFFKLNSKKRKGVSTLKHTVKNQNTYLQSPSVITKTLRFIYPCFHKGHLPLWISVCVCLHRSQRYGKMLRQGFFFLLRAPTY